MSTGTLSAAPSRAAARSRPGAIRLAWVTGAALLLLAVAVQPLRDPDVWWHLALGRLVVEHGMPAHEPFSFLSTVGPWVLQQWLYEVALVRLFDAGGAGLASLAMGVIAVAAIAAAALSVPRGARVPGAWLAAAMVLSGMVMSEVLGVRGQVITLLGTAITMLVVTRWRQGSARAVWALPPLLLLWANLHAGFVVGFAVVAIAMIAPSPLSADGGRRRPLALAALACVLATMVNPAGPAIYQYVAETFLNPTLTSAITEWLSPDFHNLWLRLLEVEALLMVALWALGGGPRRYDLLLGAAAFAATLQAQRNASLFALVAAPQIAAYGAQAWRLHVQPLLDRRSGRRRRPLHPLAAWAGAALIGLAVIAGTVLPNTSAAATASFVATRYPQAPADYVAGHLAGHRMYSIDTWGGYLAYRFPQGRVIFLYGETAAFGQRNLDTYEDVHLLRPDWVKVLRQYGIADAVIPLRSQEASGLHVLGWTVDCYDPASDAVVMSAGPGSEQPPALLGAPGSAARCGSAPG